MLAESTPEASSDSEDSYSSTESSDSEQLNRKIVMDDSLRAKKEYEFKPRLVTEILEDISESVLLQHLRVPFAISQMIAEMSSYEHDFVFTFRSVDLLKLFCEDSCCFSGVIHASQVDCAVILRLCSIVLQFEPWMMSWDSSVKSWRQSCVSGCQFDCDNRVATYHEYNLDDIVPVLSTPISLSAPSVHQLSNTSELDTHFIRHISDDYSEPSIPTRNPYSLSGIIRLLKSDTNKITCHQSHRYWYNKIHVRAKRDEIWIGVTWSKDFRSECRGYYTGELDCMISYYGGRLCRTKSLLRSMRASEMSKHRKRYSGDRSTLIKELTEARRNPPCSAVSPKTVIFDENTMTKEDWRIHHGRPLSKNRSSKNSSMVGMQTTGMIDEIRQLRMLLDSLHIEDERDSSEEEKDWDDMEVSPSEDDTDMHGYCGALNCGCGGVQTNSKVISACLEPYGTDDCISVLFDRETSYLSFWKNDRYQITVPLNLVPSFVRNRTKKMYLFTALDALGDCHVLEPSMW